MNIEFSKNGYLAILHEAVNKGYSLQPMRDAYKDSQTPVMLLRHDIDLSLDFALEIAEAEQKNGWQSTYFILLNNDFYNPLSPKGREQIQTIQSMGHEIGLHWDSSFYSSDPEQLKKSFLFETNILSQITGTPIISASQHNPIDTPALRVDGLVTIEAYSEKLNKRYTYVSDSAMTWRNHTPYDLIKKGVDIHFLSHPIWWLAEGNTISAKLANTAELSARSSNQLYQQFDEYVNQCLEEREKLDSTFKASRG